MGDCALQPCCACLSPWVRDGSRHRRQSISWIEWREGIFKFTCQESELWLSGVRFILEGYYLWVGFSASFGRGSSEAGKYDPVLLEG